MEVVMIHAPFCGNNAGGTGGRGGS